MLDEVTRKRLETVEDNREVDPVTVLKMAIEQIEMGLLKADTLLLIVYKKPDEKGEGESWHTMRSNLSSFEEITLLTAAQQKAVGFKFGG